MRFEFGRAGVRSGRSASAPLARRLSRLRLTRAQAALWLLLLACAALYALPLVHGAPGAARGGERTGLGLRVRALGAAPGADEATRQRVALALDAGEAARQRAILARIAAGDFSAEHPFEQEAGRPPVIYAAEADAGVAAAGAAADAAADSRAAFCARGAAFFASLPHSDGCSICDEHAHASRHLYRRFFAHHSWRGRGVYLESGALDGESGAQSLFFDEVLRWRGLLIEGNPPNFARALARRPRAVRLECALCAADGGDVEFVGDHGGVAGVAAAMGEELRTAFHGARRDRYRVACCALRTYWPLANLGSRIDVWFLDVEGSELAALRSVDWAATAVWLILLAQPATRRLM